MASLRKTLPKDLDELLDAAAKSGDESTVRSALERCQPNAYVRGYGKATLLMNGKCSFELAKWAVERGADVNAVNTWGRSALHESSAAAFNFSLTPAQLITLGADVHQLSNDGNTALHSAADSRNVAAIKVLLDHGVDCDAENRDGQTALEYTLYRMRNIDFVAMVDAAQLLLDAGTRVTDDARKSVTRAAKTFEFHRAGFNKESVDEFSEAVSVLCQMFEVDQPVERKMHDGVSPIVATAETSEARHAELWELLVPSSGPCQTLQGEVIRLAGRIDDEWYRNGGANWDSQYRLMADAFPAYVSSYQALGQPALDECEEVLKNLATRSERLHDLAQQWVALNPEPIDLPPPDYRR